MTELENLTVAFLCDENPLNDIDVLLNLGVKPQNMYAFTLETPTFEAAYNRIRETPHCNGVNLYQSSICDFLESSSCDGITFHIIYYDACGPLPNMTSGGTLRDLVRLSNSDKLSSPGVLISTFSGPPGDEDLQASPEGQRIKDLCNCFVTHGYNEIPLSELSESPTSNPKHFHGATFLESDCSIDFSSSNHLLAYYGTVITKVIFLTLGTLAPWVKCRGEKLYELVKKSEVESEMKKFLETTVYDLSPNFASSNSRDDEAFWNHWRPSRNEQARSKKQVLFRFLQQAIDNNSQKAEMYLNMRYWLFSVERVIAADNVGQNYRNVFTDYYKQFLGTMLKYVDELFNEPRLPTDNIDPMRLSAMYCINRLGNARHPVAHQSRRWQYVSNARTMFTDLHVFDKCKYFYNSIKFPVVDTDFIDESILMIAILDCMEKCLFYHDEQFRQYAFTGHGEFPQLPLSTLHYRFRIDFKIPDVLLTSSSANAEQENGP